jgi:hypothetical protein
MNTPIPRKVIEDFLATKAGGTLLHSSRGLTFGGAAGSLAVILLIAQLWPTKAPLLAWSLGLSAIALPFWLSLALTYEIWLSFNLDLHDLYAVKWLHRVQAAFFYCSGALTVASIALLIYALDSTVGWLFGGSCVVGLILVVASFLTASFRLVTHIPDQQHGDPRP